MVRYLAISVAVLVSAVPAFGAGIDTATVTCKDYEMGGHQDMVDIVAAFQQTMNGDPKFGSMDASQLDSAIDKACLAQPEVKVIDALSVSK